ncbi:MAG: hypothetical protein JWQ99_3125 [Blastococcus sp.]|nr:hypothetical protein [Blastococcus sp.]
MVTGTSELHPASNSTTGMSPDFAWSSSGTQASGSSAAYPMASGPRSIAAWSICSCASTSVSDAGPSKVIVTPSSLAFSSAPCLTACQNWCWNPFDTRAMSSSPLPPPPEPLPVSLPPRPQALRLSTATETTATMAFV